MNDKGLTVEVGIDLQRAYDQMVAYRDSLSAQIEVLEKSGGVCSHRSEDICYDTTQDGPEGLKWAICCSCGTWVPVKAESTNTDRCP